MNSSTPNRSMISCTLRSPTLSAAIWALRSPRFCSGMRTLTSMMRSTFSSMTPSRASSIGGMRRPSWWTSVRVRDSDAGTAPPMSVLWMWLPTKQTRRPSRNTGFQTCMSGVWVATKPLYGSLVR
ncbi:Uncharacterised protein [Bordetella pertussis]|nr:Uncharacterised protein [Bordetella pertussis]